MPPPHQEREDDPLPGHIRPASFIGYKLKVRPEDFQVEEEISFKADGKGPFGLYKFRKRGWNTVDALQKIARELRFPYQIFAYGGRKDRHAVTTQYITIRSSRPVEFQSEAFSIEHIGQHSHAISAEHIIANRFTITLRSIPERQTGVLERNKLEIQKYGLANYFDDQRFGMADRLRGFAARCFLLGDDEMGLRILLTNIHSEEKRHAKERKSAIDRAWGNWQECRDLSVTGSERKAFDYLKKHPSDFRGAVNLLPRDELSMMLSGYQSYIWNETLARVVEARGADLRAFPGRAGRLLFYHSMSDARRDLEIPTIGPGMETASAALATEALQAVLEKEELSDRRLEIPWLRGAFISSFLRPAYLEPDALEISPPQVDELYPKRRSVTLSFRLPRGAFATMVVKRLTLD